MAVVETTHTNVCKAGDWVQGDEHCPCSSAHKA